MQKIKSEFAAGTLPREHVWAYACDENEARQSIALTYGMIAMIDDAIGRILTKLSDLGLAEDTVVIFTSDHGDMLGERGLWYKMSFFEPSARVPLVVRAPDRLDPGRLNTVTSLLDLAPTLLDLARHVRWRA